LLPSTLAIMESASLPVENQLVALLQRQISIQETLVQQNLVLML
jgi:hypothetical protein